MTGLRRVFTACFLVFSLILSSPLSVHAQEDNAPSVRTDVVYQFGEELTFRAEIRSDRPVLRATVFYRARSSSTTQYAFATITDAIPAIAEVHLDLEDAGISPFSDVDYWWQLDFSETESYSTQQESFSYRDNRFAWQFLQEDAITVYWAEGDLGYGQAALDLARTSLEDIANDLVLPPPDALTLFLYPSLEGLQEALELGGQSWAGGHAKPEGGVLLVAVPAGENVIPSLEQSLPHEITHLLLYTRMGASYENIPGWLNEGLAVMQEPWPDPAYSIALTEAIERDSILPLESLCAAFPYDSDEAMLAYAESHAFVRYLRDIYGIGAIVRLLDSYQEGASCTGAVERVFHRSLQDLQTDWVNSERGGPAGLLSPSEWGAWVLVLVPAALTMIIVLVRVSIRRETYEESV